MSKFSVNKTLRNDQVEIEQIKAEILSTLEDKFQCESSKNAGNTFQISLVPRYAGKFVKSEGQVRCLHQEGRTKISFDGKHKWTGRAYLLAFFSALSIVLGGLGLIGLIFLIVMTNKGSSKNELDINEAFNEVQNFLISKAG